MPLYFKPLGAALALAVALSLGCNRAPEEPRADPGNPFKPAATAPASSAATTGAGQKCIVPLAAVAPAVPSAAGPRCPPDGDGHGKLPRARVVFSDAGVSVDAELARTDADSERGLMYRTTMGEDEGMFFFLPERRVQTFWMHNTCIPLDMIFVDTDGTIVGVVEDAPVLDDDVRKVDCPSHFVLEVNAGWVRRHHVQPGQRLIVPS